MIVLDFPTIHILITLKISINDMILGKPNLKNTNITYKNKSINMFKIDVWTFLSELYIISKIIMQSLKSIRQSNIPKLMKLFFKKCITSTFL